jgi:hypothetical protein
MRTEGTYEGASAAVTVIVENTPESPNMFEATTLNVYYVP